MLLDDKMLEINQTFTANETEDAQGMEEENLFDDWVGSASPELDASGGAEGFTSPIVSLTNLSPEMQGVSI